MSAASPSLPPAAAGGAWVIELVGLPGAGKTTLHRLLGAELEAAGWPLWTPSTLRPAALERRLAPDPPGDRRRPVAPAILSWRKLVLRGRAVLAWPAIYAQALRCLGASDRSIALKKVALHRLSLALEVRLAARSAQLEGQALLIDEGLCQAALTLFLEISRAPELEAVKRYARRMPGPDVVIYPQTALEVAIARAHDRRRGLPQRLRHLTDDQLTACLGRAGELIEVLLAGLIRRRPAMAVVRCAEEPGRSAVEEASRMKATLEELVGA